MSRDASIELVFAGDERKFRLAAENVLALQDACNAGVWHIYSAMLEGTPRYEYVFETLRIGLIGGGCDPKIAKRLVEQNIFPLDTPTLVAHAIMRVAMHGDPREEVGKPEAAADTTEGTATSPLPRSTESPEPSGSLWAS